MKMHSHEVEAAVNELRRSVERLTKDGEVALALCSYLLYSFALEAQKGNKDEAAKLMRHACEYALKNVERYEAKLIKPS